MSDRIVESSDVEVPEIPEILEKVLLFSLDEAKEKMQQGAEVIPFTALAVKENLFIESHPGETAEECFNFARHTVQNARGAEAYALCYDGYVEVDEGTRDALIAEGGIPGEGSGFAVGYLYEVGDNDSVVFEAEPAFIGDAPNFMADLKEAARYDDDEIEERYLADEAEEDVEDEDGEAAKAAGVNGAEADDVDAAGADATAVSVAATDVDAVAATGTDAAGTDAAGTAAAAEE